MTQKVSKEYDKVHYSNATGAQTAIFAGRGVLHYIVVNTTSACTIGAIDGGGNTNNVLQLKASVAEQTYIYDATIANGLVINFSAHCGDVTVVYSQG